MFNEKSDLDILISFRENSHYGLFELADIKSELENIFERHVDLVTRKSVERSSNYIRSKSILSNLNLYMQIDKTYLLDILESAKIAVEYLHDKSFDEIGKDLRTQTL